MKHAIKLLCSVLAISGMLTLVSCEEDETPKRSDGKVFEGAVKSTLDNADKYKNDAEEFMKKAEKEGEKYMNNLNLD